MLQNAKTFTSFSVPDLEQAKEFYSGKLGLSVKETPEGLELELQGGSVFLYHSTDYHAPEHTILNFVISDIEKEVDELAGKGIDMEQYPEFHTDEKGICHNDGQPGPKAIAWFKDPSGHIHSLIQEK